MHQAENDKINSDQVEEDILFNSVSDDALERTAEMWRTAAFTLGNCTGLGTCPG